MIELLKNILKIFIKTGNPKNDYVDRNNKAIAIGSDYYTQYYNWGSSWKVFDDSFDANQSM